MIYLDNAASTALGKTAKVSLCESLNQFANASSSHGLGKQTLKALETSRNELGSLLEANQLYQIVFTSSATESNNTVIFGKDWKSGDEISYFPGCHPSQTIPVFELKKIGVGLNKIKDDPANDPGEINNLNLNKKTKLILLTHVNNQSGSLLDYEALAKKIKEKFPRIHIHLDASQSFTKIPLSLKSGIIDSVTLSSHKMHGPKGVGALILKKYSLTPLLFGGGHELGIRSSSSNFPGIKSFVDQAKENVQSADKNFIKVSKLKKHLVDQLSFLEEFTEVFDQEACRYSPYIFTFGLKGVDKENLIDFLSEKEVYVSSSSACSSNKENLNEEDYFDALKVDSALRKSLIRVSFSWESTEDEVNTFVTHVKQYLDARNS